MPKRQTDVEKVKEIFNVHYHAKWMSDEIKDTLARKIVRAVGKNADTERLEFILREGEWTKHAIDNSYTTWEFRTAYSQCLDRTAIDAARLSERRGRKP